MRSIRIENSIANAVGKFTVLALAVLAWTGCAHFRKSKTECDEIINASKDASSSRSFEEKGIRLVDKGKWGTAAEAFEQAIVMDQTNGSAHNNLGLAYYHQRKLALAAAEFEIAISLLPEDPAPPNNLGMTLEAAGRGLDSLEYYSQAYELAPDKPLYLGNLVRNRIRLGDRDEEVVEQLKELLLIETRPEWVEWIEDQLALERNPYLDRGPAPPNMNSPIKEMGRSTSSNGKPLFSNPASNRAANDLLNLADPNPMSPKSLPSSTSPLYPEPIAPDRRGN